LLPKVICPFRPCPACVFSRLLTQVPRVIDLLVDGRGKKWRQELHFGLSNFHITKPLKVVDFMQLFRGHRQLREGLCQHFRPLSNTSPPPLFYRPHPPPGRLTNKFVVPCIFCTPATFLPHKYKLDKVGGAVRCPKLLASVAFNITTHSKGLRTHSKKYWDLSRIVGRENIFRNVYKVIFKVL